MLEIKVAVKVTDVQTAAQKPQAQRCTMKVMDTHQGNCHGRRHRGDAEVDTIRAIKDVAEDGDTIKGELM